MTPTLAGRLQTRLALAAVPGLPVTAYAAATLDKLTPGAALTGLLVITVLGLGWDFLSQLLQDRRWDRDWPPAFTLLGWVPEAFGSWGVLHLLGAAAPLGTHLAFFNLVWGAALLVRVVALPVLFPYWRHEGQRLLGVRMVQTPAGEAATAGAPSTEPARRKERASVLSGMALAPGRHRLAAVGLFAAVVGALIVLPPLLDDEGKPVTAYPRVATRDEGAVRTVAQRSATWDTTRRVLPRSLEFARVGVDTPLSMTVRKPDGVLVTPAEKTAAWFGEGAAPGQRGPAVMIGSTESVFRDLDTARPGNRIRVARADGSTVVFAVDEVTTVDARAFPTQKVYGADPDALLRLVGFDKASGRNTIVFAHAVSLVTPVKG